MLIIVDKKIPEAAKQKLASGNSTPGLLVELETNGLVYPAISGHPDMFFCQATQTLVIAPNLPQHYFLLLDKFNIPYVKGNTSVGEIDPGEEPPYESSFLKKRKTTENKVMTCYNAAVHEQVLVHRLEYTDPIILENCHFLKKIPVRQGYTRCNLLLLKNSHYITSDLAVHQALGREKMEGLYITPEEVILPGFPNGFLGGAMGLFEDNIYIIGNLRHLKEGRRVSDFLAKLNYRVIELYDGPLFDGGGILFIQISL